MILACSLPESSLVPVPVAVPVPVPFPFPVPGRITRITSAGRSTRPADNADSPDGTRDLRADGASYAPGCPSCSPWRRGHIRRDLDAVYRLCW